MSTSKVLQTPQIIDIVGSTIRVAHPDISDYTKTSLVSDFSSGGTSLSVRDNNNFEDNDWFILGDVAHAKTEECDVNGAVTRGTSLTITNTTKFDHEIDTPVTRIFERKIKIYGAATDGGSGTLIASIDALTGDAFDIQWDKEFSEWTLISTDTAYAYYYATFYDGTTESSASDYVPSTGLAYNTAKKLIESGLKHVNAEVDGKLITWEWLLDKINDWQDAITSYVMSDGTPKDWTFEITEDTTSISVTQNENKYATSGFSTLMKYPDSAQALIGLRIGPNELSYIDLDQIETEYDGTVRTEVQTEAAAGSTTLVLDDTVELQDSGTVYVGSMTVTYTAKDDDTNTLSGIPASGTGALTSTATVDMVVWQGVTPGTPDKYTIFNGDIILNKPCEEDIVGYKLKAKYYGVVGRLTALSNVTPITITKSAKYYIGSEIEARKGNTELALNLMAQFVAEVEREAQRNMSHVAEAYEYYTFSY